LNKELLLITKVLDSGKLDKVLNSKVTKSFLQYQDVWDFIEEYYFKYKVIPSIEIVVEKHPEFEPEQSEESVSIDFLIDEVNNAYLEFKLEDVLMPSISWPALAASTLALRLFNLTQ